MTTDTKRHIDAARQVLVGVVPNPTSQIDQITNALIYKFMDDMDQSAIKQGGDPSFFVGDLEQYAWTRLMDARIGNQERMNMYGEALIKFSESKQLPQLFREIFKSAFLPYRSPEVLGLFLKEIDYFDYSHPEELGNAYEYLLSIMSSQGDAGQFRTPRHIIDFMVEVVDPTIEDKVLDPACGTGGFLVSAYKHILKQHDGKDDLKKKERPLTPDQRKNLMGNFEGYDVDPGMVRIAQVNMYLHSFKNPKIYPYDTLTMEERWSDKFSVILANPPFMSPKGGVSTHKKFSIQSNRSEVLFVDYIMNHLRPQGRAGIIVPEGIIFQSGTAHKQLRKNLVEDGLYAVVSLPSGVFNPYAGVKTSILFFDNELAKKSDDILFIKILNDGFDLGAQRRPHERNDLPHALKTLQAQNTAIQTGNENSLLQENSLFAWVVKKEKIAESGEYNLSGDRYRVATDYTNAKWPMVELGEVAEILKGSAITKKDTAEGNIPVIAGGQEPAYYHNESNRNGEVITVSASGAYAGFVNYFNTPIFASDCSTIQTKDEKVVSTKYLFHILKAKQEDIYAFQQGGGQPHVYPRDLKKIKIPLPPIEIQEQVVAELNGYQNIIAGAKQIVSNWKPIIDIDPEWKKVKLKEIGKVCMCKRIFKEQTGSSGDIPFYKIGTFGKTPDAYIDRKLFEEYKSKYSYPKKGAILISTSGTIGKIVVFDGEPAYFQDSNIVWIDNDEKLVSDEYLYYMFQLTDWVTTKGGTIERLYNKLIEETIIPLPPLEIQKQIVERIESERALVEGNKKLIEMYEQKTKATLAKLWAE